MAVPHPLPIPVNVHPVPLPSAPHPQQYVMQQQGGPSMPAGMQGYPHPYAIRPPPQNMNALAMSSQQAAALHEQQQQRIRLSQQQQIAANHAAVAQQQAAQQAAHQQAAQAAQAAAAAQQSQAAAAAAAAAQQQQQQRAVPAPSPHIPNPSPHLAHQFPPGHPAHYQQHPQGGPPGVPLPPGAPGGGLATPQPVGIPSPAVAMRQPPHPQARPPAHPFQQHPGMAPGQHMAQPMVHSGSQQGHPPPQPQNGAHLQPIPENGDFAMSRGNSGPPRQWDLDGLLKLYIFDYLVKNNFGQLAAKFNAEARLENQGAPVNVPEGGALQEWFTVFWDVFSGGKGAQGASSVAGYQEAMNRLKSLRNQQFGFPANYGQFPPGQQPQPVPGQQVLAFRPPAPGQPNGMSPAQIMQQQQIAQQQANSQQAAAAQNLLIQQRQAQQRFGAAGPSASPAQQPPAGHPMYAQHIVPPNAQPGPPHSPIPPSPHVMQAQQPVMPSPHQRKMPGPQMNGPPGAGVPMRAATPQNGPPPPGAPGAPQFGAPVPPSPAAQAMTPQLQHQQQQMMQAHAQAMQQRAQASLAEVQQAQLHAAAAQNQHAAQMQNHAHHQQLQAMQAHQAQQVANSMYQGLGLGQVNPNIMQASANSLGLGGRAVDSMGEDDRNRLIQQYRLTMQENQRRQMHSVNGGVVPNPQQQQMMQAQMMQAQQQQQQHAHAQAQAQAQAMQAAQQAQAQQQLAQQQQQPKVPSRNGTGQFDQATPMQQTESARGASPTEGGSRGTKRARRNSAGSSAQSPFIQGGPTPGFIASTPQGQTPQMQPLGTPGGVTGAGNQHSAQQQAMTLAQMQADAANANAAAAARSGRTLGPNGSAQFTPQTPNALEAPSPAQGNPAQSPRNTTALNMQRNQSKGGAMLPPQSPATTLQRSTTPKPTVAGKTTGATPKAATPKSLNPSPNTAAIPVLPGTESAPNSAPAQGLTPSPPSVDPISTAPTSVPSTTNGAVPFKTDTITTDDSMDASLFELGNDFDFASLMGPNGDGFDFNMYLQYEGDEGGEAGTVP